MERNPNKPMMKSSASNKTNTFGAVDNHIYYLVGKVETEEQDRATGRPLTTWRLEKVDLGTTTRE